eukprot:UN00389
MASNSWMNIMCGLYDNSTPSISVNDISVPIPINISHQSTDITPYNYDDTPIYHIDQFTTPIIHNKPDINTFNFNPQNHTMITYGIKIKTVLPTHSNQNEYDVIITQCYEASKRHNLCDDVVHVITQEIEIECIDDNFSDDYDEEIAINSDSSLSQSSSDGVSDYIPSTLSLSEESFYIQNVPKIIINDADYSQQSKMLFTNI